MVGSAPETDEQAHGPHKSRKCLAISLSFMSLLLCRNFKAIKTLNSSLPPSSSHRLRHSRKKSNKRLSKWLKRASPWKSNRTQRRPPTRCQQRRLSKTNKTKKSKSKHPSLNNNSRSLKRRKSNRQWNLSRRVSRLKLQRNKKSRQKRLKLISKRRSLKLREWSKNQSSRTWLETALRS